MKNNLMTVLTGLLLTCPLLGFAQGDLKQDPAYLRIDEVLDFKQAKPEVNVNLPRFLLQNAVSEFNGGTEDPFAAAGINLSDLIKDIKLIRVVIMEATAENRQYIDQAVGTLRKDLEAKWTTLVSIPEEHIGVYAMSDPGGERMGGLAVLIADDGDIIIANVVGSLPLGKILKLAGQMQGANGEMIRKALAQFSGNTTESNSAPAAAEVETKKE